MKNGAYFILGLRPLIEDRATIILAKELHTILYKAPRHFNKLRLFIILSDLLASFHYNRLTIVLFDVHKSFNHIDVVKTFKSPNQFPSDNLVCAKVIAITSFTSSIPSPMSSVRPSAECAR